MTQLCKVVWSEGMHLAQHHFQTQSRYFEDSIHFALSHLFFAPYGLGGCVLDAEALLNGTLSLIHARGIMPDGLAFNMPDGDCLPQPSDIRDRFSPTHDSHLVVLTVAPFRTDGPNCALEANGASNHTRYAADTSVVPDETTGRDSRKITVARKRFELVLDSEVADDAVSLPLARVRRDGAGRLIFDPEYIPPCLQIGASERLMELLRRLIEILDAKSDAMAERRQPNQRSIAGYAGHEVASFWFLNAIHSSVAALRHQFHTRQVRPEQLYTDMGRLAGSLCTFAVDSHPRELPLYDHDHLDQCFGALDQHIREHLEIVIPTSCISIPLQPAAAYLYAGSVLDKRCFGRARWIFGIRSSAGEADVITRVPQLVKICSKKFTPELVRRAYPGLTLQHLPNPPAAIAPKVGNQYFSIRTEGPCWETIVSSGEVGVYVPDAIPGAEPELLVVLERNETG